jgi:hypothetical protein
VAALLTGAAILFVAYPVLRPYSTEQGLDGARAFGSNLWVAAHTCGMFAFLGLAAATVPLRTGNRLILPAVALLLPYYGAEAFGLHAIGNAALRLDQPGLTSVVDQVRDNPVALTMFGAGWILLAVGGIALGIGLWRRGGRVGAVVTAVGLVLYLPQFYGPPWVRIAHGCLLAVGLLLVAVDTVRRPNDGR